MRVMWRRERRIRLVGSETGGVGGRASSGGKGGLLGGGLSSSHGNSQIRCKKSQKRGDEEKRGESGQWF